MSIVTLVSGGLDSTVMAVLADEEKLQQFPLFIDYGQVNRDKEYHSCLYNFKRIGLPTPEVINLAGFGSLISSGLTDTNKRVLEDAFLPCRNLLFLTVGAAYAYQCNANAVAIALLDETISLFPDQTRDFISEAEALISKSLGRSICIKTPLISFSKADVILIAKARGIEETYSCHSGTEEPCGVCIACREYSDWEV